jgi:predicted ATPase
VALFAARARAVLPGFAVTPDNAAAVRDICRRLDGLPLAIELAAVRSLVLDPAAPLARLRLSLLSRAPADVPARHRTMRYAIDWSHQLLTPAEQRLFRRLSVFAGWDVTAAEAVCPAEQQLDAAGEAPGVQERLALLMVDLAERAEKHLDEADQQRWLDHVDRELDNIRAVLRRADPGTVARIVTALFRYWLSRGYHHEERGWLDWLLDRADALDPKLCAQVRGHAAWIGPRASGAGRRGRRRRAVHDRPAAQRHRVRTPGERRPDHRRRPARRYRRAAAPSRRPRVPARPRLALGSLR